MLELNNITKSYDRCILNNLSANFKEGGINLLYGRSGSGKTTLLNCCSGVEIPQEGDVIIDETCLGKLSDHDRANFRLKNIGIIYQFFNLLPSLSVAENILLPAMILRQDQKDHMHHLAKEFDIVNLLQKWPTQLSGGECQRVAICRALICQPKLILADEPTGNLDIESRDIVMQFLKTLTASQDLCIIIATHDQDLQPHAESTWSLEGGQLNQIK